MRRAAQRARNLLPDPSGLTRVVDFLSSQVNDDGGFADRAGRSDLYYTVFGLEASAALGLPSPANLSNFLAQFRDIDRLDFVHATCLARCWASLPPSDAVSQADRSRLLERIESFRTPDGGYNQWPDQPRGTAYGCILAMGTYQDLDGPPMPQPHGLLDCLRTLRADDGGYVNEPNQAAGLTPATAAAITVQIELGEPTDPRAVDWLFARHQPAGGFSAMPSLPLADLLSTATALHALARAGADIAAIRSTCRRFVLGQWDNGAFRGHAFDNVRDCEYTFYGLLALGELASDE